MPKVRFRQKGPLKFLFPGFPVPRLAFKVHYSGDVDSFPLDGIDHAIRKLMNYIPAKGSFLKCAKELDACQSDQKPIPQHQGIRGQVHYDSLHKTTQPLAFLIWLLDQEPVSTMKFLADVRNRFGC